MNIIFLSLSLSVLFVGFGIFANKVRSRPSVSFELESNCLLTRWPFLFITGPRSIFYFSSYWNIYTSFLAEHGYEVFTLNLPWNKNSLRRERFKSFLTQQQKSHRHFHLVMDHFSFEELKDIIQESPDCVVSITELGDSNLRKNSLKRPTFPILKETLECTSSKHPSLVIPFCYNLHRHLTGYHTEHRTRHLTNKDILPSLDTLGANPATAISNSLKLLDRAKTLAEIDLMNG